jgi:hypothetical protein
MNPAKLQKLAQQVRTGGKGSVRRKKKAVHKTTTTDDKRLQRRSRPCFMTSLQNFCTFRVSCVRRFLCGPKPCNSCSISFDNSSYSLSGKQYLLLQRRIWTTEAPYTISSSRLPTNQVPKFFCFSLLATTKKLQIFLFPSLLETV